MIEQDKRCKRHGFNPWVGKIPWSRKRLPTPVFLLGKFHELATTVQDVTKSQTQLNTHTYTHTELIYMKSHLSLKEDNPKIMQLCPPAPSPGPLGLCSFLFQIWNDSSWTRNLEFQGKLTVSNISNIPMFLKVQFLHQQQQCHHRTRMWKLLTGPHPKAMKSENLGYICEIADTM